MVGLDIPVWVPVPQYGAGARYVARVRLQVLVFEILCEARYGSSIGYFEKAVSGRFAVEFGDPGHSPCSGSPNSELVLRGGGLVEVVEVVEE